MNAFGNIVMQWGSRFNHSCLPNATYYFEGNTMKVRTPPALKPNDEVTISYLPTPFLPRQEHQQRLKADRNFSCTCEACTDDAKENEILDIIKDIEQGERNREPPTAAQTHPKYKIWVNIRVGILASLIKRLEGGDLIVADLAQQ